MSKDIRSFFMAKPSTATTPTAQKRKPPAPDSDEEEEKSRKIEKTSPSKKESTKSKKRRILDSDEEDEVVTTKKPKETISSKLAKVALNGAESKKMKLVNGSSVFGDKPVKRIEKEKKPKKTAEKRLLDNTTDDSELIDIDEDALVTDEPKKPNGSKDSEKRLPKKDSEKKGNDENKVSNEKTPPLKKQAVETVVKEEPTIKEVKKEKQNPIKVKKERDDDDEDEDAKPSKKTSRTPASSKKRSKVSDESELDTSVYDPDQEKHERRRASAVLYKQFQNRAGPANPGSKEIPKGKPNCLAGLAFVLTGVFDSMERDEAASVIKSLGGRVTSALSGKTSYLVIGEESGPAKIAKAEDANIPVIDEDGLLDLIREKSGLPTLSKKTVEVKAEKVTPKKEKTESPAKSKRTQSPVKSKRTESPVKQKTPEKPKSLGKQKSTEKLDVQPKQDAIIKREPISVGEKALAWVDKYKPKNIKDIIGQGGPASNCAKLVNWLSKWHKNNNGQTKKQRPNPWAKNDDGSFFKAALLSGPPGVGKTTTAQLVCEHLGFDTIEFNASDTRSKKLLQIEVSELLSNKTLHGYFNGRNTSLTEKQVLLMDEVDGMAGNEDRGGMQELINLIKTSSVPIICMCNDRNHPKIRSLVNYCYDLRFARPPVHQIKAAVLSILFKEKLKDKISPKTVEEIITATNNDVRQTLNSISLLSAKTDFPDSKLRSDNGKKDLKLGPWEVVRKVFSAEEHKTMSLNDKSDLFFNDYSLGPLFVHQNYLMVSPSNVPKSKTIEQIALTADSLSLGDMVEKKIRTSMAWSMLPVQAMYSSVLPGEYMSGNMTGQINFPGWLGKNSKTTKRSRLAQEIHDHTRLRTSASRQSIRLDYAPFLLQNIVHPLIEDQNDGVEEALSVIKEYHLLREDIDALVELSTWPGKKSPMDQVDGRVKAALTRAYNKEVAPYSYSTANNVKKKKTAAADDDYLNEYGEGGDQMSDSDDGDDDNVDNDAMIKQKKSAVSKASTSKASTSKASTSKAASGGSKRAGTSKKK